MTFKFNAILKFNGAQAIAGMRNVSKGFAEFQTQANKISAGFSQINQGVRGAAIGLAPFALGTAFATKTAAAFEQQMSGVRSVLRITTEAIAPLETRVKQLGIETIFTASEVGSAAEFLARAGFTMKETGNALAGVLDAAAATGTDLAITASIVATNVRAFGLEASQATEVADALALTTALTNTNFIELGEAMKFAAPLAAQANISMAEVASTMGVLANAGIKGTLGGTALKNTLAQLSKPSKKVLEFFGGQNGLNQAVLDFGKGGQELLPMEVIMANISKVVQRSSNRLEAAGRAAEIFGLRGTNAFGAFTKQMLTLIPITDQNIDQLVLGAKRVGQSMTEFIEKGSIPKLVALRLQMAGASGTAKEMARIRLDNLIGQFIKFKSAVEGVSIETGGLLLGPLKGILKTGTDALKLLVFGFQVAKTGAQATGDQLAILNDNQFADLKQSAILFARGFIRGFEEVKQTAKATFNFIKSFLQPFFEDSETFAVSLGNFVAKFIAIATIAAPLLAGFAAFAFVASSIFVGFLGVLTTIAGVVGTIALSLQAFTIIAGVLGVSVGLVAGTFVAIAAGVALAIAGIVIFRNELFDFFSRAGTAFNETFINPSIVGAFKLGDVLLEALLFPFTVASSMLKVFVSTVASGLGGILNLVGFSNNFSESVDNALKRVLGNNAIDNFFGIGPGIAPTVTTLPPQSPLSAEASQLILENLTRQSSVQPPSAQENALATSGALQGAGFGQSSQQQSSLQVIVGGEFRLRGRDLNAVITRIFISTCKIFHIFNLLFYIPKR